MDQIHEITKLTLSKLSSMQINDQEIKESVASNARSGVNSLIMFSDPQFWVFIAFIIFIGVIFKPVRKILSINLR